ncbi:uncharacterized protein LOC117115004 isoform X2 [Anneissia japonica]|uniref:uncharacterized protein LOC117115004 isoform X2 n=1 Tax=Anneissia japonica TaxID=1529436 RepID=UPI00142583B7|nr:uncharacterized protein LOC117115004 isoform X2 [Anneissia japonica]
MNRSLTGLYSESDINPPKPEYGTILNHGRKRIQSAKEVRNNSKRSSLLRKIFTKAEKKSDPDSDIYQANSFHRLCIPSSNAMGTCCSTSQNPSSYSKQQSENFSRTFPHKREFEGVTRNPTRSRDKNSCTENDKNRSNVVRVGDDNDVGNQNGRNSADIWVGHGTPKRNGDARKKLTEEWVSGDDNKPRRSRPFPRSIVVNNETEERDTNFGVRKAQMQPQVSRHRKLTPAVPLTIPVFKAQMPSTLPPVGDVEELEYGRDDSRSSRSSNSTPTKVKPIPPSIQYHSISPPCSSSWPSLSNGGNYPHIPPSTPPHRRMLCPSPKHLQVTSRQNYEIPKRKLVRKLTPIILEVPKNLEGRNHSISDDEEESNEFFQNGVYGYESMVERVPKTNGLSDEYKEELKNTVDELIDQLSPTIMGDEFVDRPFGRPSPSYWHRQSSEAGNFVFPDVRVNGKLEMIPPFNGINGDVSPSMTPLNSKVHRRKITPAPSAHPPLYKFDPTQMKFSSSAFAEDEELL